MAETAAAAPRGRRKRRSAGNVIWDVAKKALFVLFTLCAIGALTAGLFFHTFMRYADTVLAPEMDVDIQALTLKQSSTVYYQDKASGAWLELTKLHGSENRTIVTYDQIPDHVVKALIAVEDKRFYEHKGVDWVATAGQVRNMLTGKDVRGASTITQQVIKNVTHNDEVTIRRKILEIFRALRAHKNYSNEEILETYFNLVYYGDGAYGIEAAAETYFGKTASELDVAEGAAIIGITQYPYLYDPSRGEKYRAANKERQEWVLKKMWEQGYLTEAEYERAKSEQLVFVWDADFAGESEAAAEAAATAASTELDSFFVEQVYRDVVAALVEQGYGERVASQMIYNGGYQIYCTVDPEIQEYVEQVYADRANFNYNSASGQQLQSGVTIIDNQTGDIVAIGGRVGERKGALEWSYATGNTQCGSAIKPLSVYAPAIDAGLLTAASVIDDYPVYRIDDDPWPVNAYDGYKGLVTIQYALRQSSNTCAVRTLQRLTPAASYAFMTEKLGFTTLDSVDLASPGALGLGGLHVGVSTVAMAAAYETFAANGVYTKPRTFTQVLDANGSVVIDNQRESWVAMKETTVYTMNELLKNVMRAGGTGVSAAFGGMTQAGKTGTTNSKHDRYFCGYTPYYTAAVWCGYDQPERIPSDNPSALVWKKLMSHIHEGLANRDFPTTDAGMVSVTVCDKTGLLAGDGCTETRTVLVAEGTAPVHVCDAHVTVDYCTVSNEPAGAFCPKDKREAHSVIDLTQPNTAEGFGYVRELFYQPMTQAQYDSYAAQVEAGLRDEMPDGAPLYAEDSGQMLADILAEGTCTWHRAQTELPTEEPEAEEPIGDDEPAIPVSGREQAEDEGGDAP
ncbi:MAG: transglycosylase domain-containing protein [Oscillospiraceae bacterium]|nr:transglycosylase domain-containing protein [Oscillospiraceae bacterium]